MFGGNSFMRGPGGFGHGPGRRGPGGFGPRGPRGPMGPRGPHRHGGFGYRPHMHRHWGGPPHHHGCGCMGCLLPVLALLAMVGGALFVLLAYI